MRIEDPVTGFVFTITSTVTVRPIQLSLCGRNVLQARKAPSDKFTYYCDHAKYRVENTTLFAVFDCIRCDATPSSD